MSTPEELAAAIERLEATAFICENVTTAVHFYNTDKDELAKDIRILIGALKEGANNG